MIETKVSRRYAKSLLDLAKERSEMDTVHSDIKLFISVAEDNKDLLLLLANPIISSDKKLSIMKTVFEGRISKLTMSFFGIIIRKGRESHLFEVAKEFVSQYKIMKGIQTAEITSAVGLDDKLRSEVYRIIREATKSEVELVEKVDKNLIGGFVLRMGDRQYDASVSASLKRLARTFADKSYIRQN